jgi:EthD domain
VLVELYLAPSSSSATLGDAIGDVASRLQSRSPAAARVTWGRRIHDPARAGMEATGLCFDDDVRGYLAAVLDLDDGGRLSEAVAPLADVVDRERSRLAASVPRPIVAGTGPIGLFHILRRRDGLTREEFLEYWGGGHTRFSRTIPGLEAYVQHVVDPDRTLSLAGAVDLPPADFDGVAVTYTSSIEAHVELMGRSQAKTGVRDNETFVAVYRSPYITLVELLRC